jgi:lipoate-protein ligase A
MRSIAEPPPHLLTGSPAHRISCSLIIDQPADGAWNMALDEALLQAAEKEGIATLRSYQWNEPTLSLGYFQSHADRRLHPASENCPLVRRSTGGGAILHDHELTYSIILPLVDGVQLHSQWLYSAVHESLIETLADFGIPASKCIAQASHPASSAAEPFLCFQRHTPGDVLVGEHKIAGSAQRRRRCAILQHGSILLAKSAAAPELQGIIELTGIHLSAHQLQAKWQPRLAAALELELDEAAHHSAGLLTAAAAISREKFTATSWNWRR